MVFINKYKFVQQIQIQNKLKKKMDTAKKKMGETRKKKTDPLLELEGNQKLNKINKLQFKKQKKEQARRGAYTTKKLLFLNIECDL